jgi:membrane protease YdiL (CAAX protease family)
VESNSASKNSLPSPKRWDRSSNSFPILQSLLTAIGVALIWILSMMLIFFCAGRMGYDVFLIQAHQPTPAQTTLLFVLQDLSYLPPTIFLLRVVPRLAKRTLSELGMARFRASDLRRGFIGAVTAWFAVAVTSALYDALTRREHHQNELALFHHLDPMQTCVAVTTAVVLAPLFEELLFRFFLFNAFLRYMPVSLAVVLSSAIFGIAHGQFDVALLLAVCGMVLALVYYRSGSFWANSVAHACFNGFTTVALLVFHVGS